VSFATFAVYTMVSNEPLNAQLVFVAVTLFNLLQFPLIVFPSVIASGVEAMVALRRLENFLHAEELDLQAVIRQDYRIDSDAHTGRIELVSVKNGYFKWDKLNEVILEDINLSVKKGELVAVVGKVGKYSS
jgi:ATP-binding cassette, subfamily C (CFTR/MRP), member 1